MKKQIIQLATSKDKTYLELAYNLAISIKWLRGILIIKRIVQYHQIPLQIFKEILKVFKNVKYEKDLNELYSYSQRYLDLSFDECLELGFDVLLNNSENDFNLGLLKIEIENLNQYKQFKYNYYLNLNSNLLQQEALEIKDWNSFYSLEGISTQKEYKDFCKNLWIEGNFKDINNFLRIIKKCKGFDLNGVENVGSIEFDDNFYYFGILDNCLVFIDMWKDLFSYSWKELKNNKETFSNGIVQKVITSYPILKNNLIYNSINYFDIDSYYVVESEIKKLQNFQIIEEFVKKEYEIHCKDLNFKTITKDEMLNIYY